jgi:hypothetical protein
MANVNPTGPAPMTITWASMPLPTSASYHPGFNGRPVRVSDLPKVASRAVCNSNKSYNVGFQAMSGFKDGGE